MARRDGLEMYDVAVIGAGPSGSNAAFHLERMGLDTLLLDRRPFPRKKPCAGVLPPRIFDEVDIPGDVIERDLSGYRVHSPSGRVVETGFSRPGAIVRREVFDAYLVGRLQNPVTVDRVMSSEEKGDHVALTGRSGSYRARFVVGADGANSVVRRRLGISYGSVADAIQYEVKMNGPDIDRDFGDFFEVFYLVHQGYGWLSPLRDAIKVGAGSVDPNFGRGLRRSLDGFVHGLLMMERLQEVRIGRIEAWRIPMSGPVEPPAVGRFLLAGDAGGFVFPGTGEGVYYAMKSGRLAAEALREALQDDLDPSELAEAYAGLIRANGLMSLRDIDFVGDVLSSPERVERYVRRLDRLSVG